MSPPASTSDIARPRCPNSIGAKYSKLVEHLSIVSHSCASARMAQRILALRGLRPGNNVIHRRVRLQRPFGEDQAIAVRVQKLRLSCVPGGIGRPLDSAARLARSLRQRVQRLEALLELEIQGQPYTGWYSWRAWHPGADQQQVLIARAAQMHQERRSARAGHGKDAAESQHINIPSGRLVEISHLQLGKGGHRIIFFHTGVFLLSFFILDLWCVLMTEHPDRSSAFCREKRPLPCQRRAGRASRRANWRRSGFSIPP